MTETTMGLIVIDASQNVVYANQAAEEIAGSDVTQLVVRPGFEHPWSLAHKDGGLVFAAANPGEGLLPMVAGARLVKVMGRDGDPCFYSVSVDSLHSFERHKDHVVIEIQRVPSWQQTDPERLQAASLAAVGQPVIVADPQGRVVFWNPSAGHALGWSEKELVGFSMDSFMTPSDGAACERNPGGTIDASSPWTGEVIVQRRDGSSFLTVVSQTPVFDDFQSLVARVTVLTDTADRRRSTGVIPVQFSLPGSSPDAIFTVALNGTVESWSSSAEALFGYRADEIVGRAGLLRWPTSDPASVPDRLAAVAVGKTVSDFETIYRHRDGSAVAVAVSLAPMYDDAGAVIGVTLVARGTSHLAELTRSLNEQANHDAVTGLPNRRLLSERLKTALSTRGHRGLPVSVLFMSIDQFKTVGFANGHDAGDELLVEVTARLAAVTRPPDTLACFGSSGEFVMVCVDTDDTEVGIIVGQVQIAFLAPFEIRGEPIYLSVTVGTAVTPPLAANAETLLSQADAAREEARSLGRAHFSASDMNLTDQSKARLELRTDIRDALANDKFEVHYQPVIDLATGRTIGVEAILRWNHATRGWVPQSEFRPLAAKSRLTAELDSWTTYRAVHDAALMRGWGVLEPGQTVRIGIAARSILDPNYVTGLRDCLAAGRIPAGVVELELAGPAFVPDEINATGALDSLSQLGVSIALRDFGMGHDPLKRSPHPAVRTICIDQELIGRLTESPANLAITTSLIEMAHAIGMETVALGVTRVDQLALLQRLGCTAGQGILWCPAAPRDEFATLARRNQGGFEPAERESAAARRGPVRVTNEHGLHRLEQLYREGASFTTIAAALNADHFRTPQNLRWHGKSVSDVVSELKLDSSGTEPVSAVVPLDSRSRPR